MREITLLEVLDAREARAFAQKRLLEQCQKPLLGLNMNIAGPVKRSKLIDLAFRAAQTEVRRTLGSAILKEELTDAATGLEAIWVCDLSAEELKSFAITLETKSPVGRLYDLDVIATDGSKLSRAVPRTCLVCGGPVGPCSRSRAMAMAPAGYPPPSPSRIAAPQHPGKPNRRPTTASVTRPERRHSGELASSPASSIKGYSVGMTTVEQMDSPRLMPVAIAFG